MRIHNNKAIQNHVCIFSALYLFEWSWKMTLTTLNAEFEQSQTTEELLILLY